MPFSWLRCCLGARQLLRLLLCCLWLRRRILGAPLLFRLRGSSHPPDRPAIGGGARTIYAEVGRQVAIEPQFHPLDRHRSAELRYHEQTPLGSRSLTFGPRSVAMGRGLCQPWHTFTFLPAALIAGGGPLVMLYLFHGTKQHGNSHDRPRSPPSYLPLKTNRWSVRHALSNAPIYRMATPTTAPHPHPPFLEAHSTTRRTSVTVR